VGHTDLVFLYRDQEEVLKAFAEAEKEKKPPIRTMFEDIYEEMTPQTRKQMEELRDVIKRYPEEYDVGEFEGQVVDEVDRTLELPSHLLRWIIRN